MKQHIKKVSFNLEKNQIYLYKRYIHKYKYKTKYNILFSFLYKDINDTNWYKYLPTPSLKKFNKKILLNNNNIYIFYYVNKWNKICLQIENNIQRPSFFSQHFDIKGFNVIDFRIIIINHIRLLCFNNDIY
jgi:hypothetical protein